MLTPKWVSIFTVMIIVIGLFFDRTYEMTVMITTLLLTASLAITVHELGHVFLGKLNGFKFVFFVTGPFQFEKTRNGIKLTENKQWLLFGGVAMMTPPIEKQEMMRKKIAWYTAGGPIFSFSFVVMSYLLYTLLSRDFFLLFTIMNIAIFIATIIPMKMGMKTDGYTLLTLLKSNEESSQLIEEILISRELLSRKQPSEWNETYIQIAKQKTPCIGHLQFAMLIYYYQIEQSGFQSAEEAMADYCRIPVTKKTQMHLGFLIHMQQISYFLTENIPIKKIIRLQQQLSRLEPVSYYRGLAIVAYLQGDQQAAIKNMDKVEEITQQYNELYGFFTAEKTLTKLVKEKIILEPT